MSTSQDAAGTSVSALTVQHLKRTVGPVIHDYPAGQGCAFAYHWEDTRVQNIKRFFDESGTLIREIRLEEDVFLHRNADTGYTLTETDHFYVEVEYVDGVRTLQTLSGNQGHLVDEDGRLVLLASGRAVFDFVTGELVFETPHWSGDDLCAVLAQGQVQ